MTRSTKKGRPNGKHLKVASTSSRDISQDPDMIALKRLLKQLPPDRLQAFTDYLSESEAAETTTKEPSQGKLLRMVAEKVLPGIQPADRPIGATAPGRNAQLKTIATAMRIPTKLFKELDALPGPRSRNIEKAIMLYLKVVKAGGKGGEED